VSAATKPTTDLLNRWQAGDKSARDRLLEHCCERLRALAHRMLRQSFPHVGRWEQTDDVLQRAMLRLYQSLEAVTLQSGRHFHNLAATQIRRELIELARHYYGPLGQGAKHETDRPADGGEGGRPPKHDPADWSAEPSSVAEWADFHRGIEELPAEEREVVELLWYQGLGQEEAAEVLGVTDRTVRRRWVAARTRLYQAFGGELPA
jgi:RNA polymerase sigma-70 factor (ECF subfamily)